MPEAITGMDELVAQDTSWAPHAHPTHELLWNARGASLLRVGPRAWTITPGLGMWVPAGTVHTGFAPEGTWYRAAQFSIEVAPTLADGPVAVEITPLLRLLLTRLDEALDPASRRLTEAMIIDVLRPSPTQLLVVTPAAPILAPIVAALETDPSDGRTLAGWAAELGASERTLTRAFHRDAGMSFLGWRAQVRAQRAIALLAEGLDPEDVAGLVGYRSLSAFGAALRRTTGLTPGAFRP